MWIARESKHIPDEIGQFKLQMKRQMIWKLHRTSRLFISRYQSRQAELGSPFRPFLQLRSERLPRRWETPVLSHPARQRSSPRGFEGKVARVRVCVCVCVCVCARAWTRQYKKRILSPQKEKKKDISTIYYVPGPVLGVQTKDRLDLPLRGSQSRGRKR